MATIDDKVVAMSFESSKFEAGVNKAISSLEKLKASLQFKDAGKGFDSINKAASKLNFGSIGRALESIKSRLAAFRLVAIGVMANIASSAVRAGGRFVKAFTLDPIIAGFHEYSTNLNAVQTILANTQAAGTKLKDVNKALNELNRYSDKTIYNFSQMARNIGTFTAAGVDLKTSTASIKGIANLAALSGSNADQASTAMYQLSQAISAGSVKLQDWNSVVNAGMGGTVFQRALAQTAEAMGTLNKGAVKLEGPMKNVSIHGEAFRQSLSTPGKASWLTSKVLTTTLKQFTGDLSDAELAAMGFTDAQIMSIQQTAKTAMHAATEVKTIQQVFDVAKETAGSGWAATFQIIFGTFTEAKKTFTDMSNAINGFINANAAARNKVLADWKALGGRTVLIDSIKIAFHNLGLVLAPIKKAFRDIFPATTGKDLYNLTLRFQEFAKAIKPTPQTVEGLRRTFRGLFALLDIGKQIIGGIFTVFGQLFGAVGKGSGSFLDFTGSIGDFLVSVDKALKKGNTLHDFFVRIGQVLSVPIQILAKLQEALANVFSKFAPGGFSAQMAGMSKGIGPLAKVVDALAKAWENFINSFGGSDKIMQPVADAFVKFIQGFGPALNKAIAGMNFAAILEVIKVGLLGGLVVMFKQFLGRGSAIDQITKGFGKGILGNISGSFKALQGSMVGLQQNIKAKTLKEIAIAIALLTASVVALSFVDPKKLNAALAAMAIGFGQLLGAMFILTNVTKTVGFIKLPVIAGSLILLAGAIDVLALAVIALGKLSWGELIKGLGGVAVLLIGITAAAIPLSASSAGMIRAGAGITAMAVGLRILANAVAAMGALSLGTMAKGLGGLAVGLIVIAGAMQLMPKNMLLTGAGLVAVAVGLRIIANVVAKFGELKWGEIGKGMAGIAGALVIIAAAMTLMPGNMLITAAGLLVVSIALQGIVKAVGKMGGMSVSALAKGLIGLALSLTILAAALYAMSGALPGAAALAVAASGLALLAPALVAMGKQSWTSILKGLITLAAALTVIGIAGALITPVIPSLLGLGAALLLIGAGLALAGAGIALIGMGLSALVVAAPTGFGVILAAIIEFQKGIIQNAKLLILGLLEIVRALANTAPQFVDALVKIIESLVDAITRSSPNIGEAFNALIKAALGVIDKNKGNIIQAGYGLIIALLQGIRNNIGAIVRSVVQILQKFLGSIASNFGRIIKAGANILFALLKGIVGVPALVAKAAVGIITKFISAIATVYAKIATAGLTILTKLLNGIANNLGKVIKAGTDVIVNFIKGIGNAGPRVITAATNTIIKFMNSLSKNSVKLANAGAQAIVHFLNGIAKAIETYAPQMRSAGIRIAVAIIDGMTFGLVSNAGKVVSAAGGLVGKVKKKLEFWKSPPSAYGKSLGQEVVLGLAEGLSNHTDATNAAASMSQGVIATVTGIFQTASPSKVMRDIGRDVAGGFAEGIRKGTGDDIRQAFSDMSAKLNDAIRSVREDIAANKAKIREEMAKKPKERDKSAIAEARQAKKNELIEVNRLKAAHKELVKGLKEEEAKLITNAKKHAELTDRIETETQKLEDLRRVRDDAFDAYKEQYRELPDVTPEDPTTGQPVADPVGVYKAALQTQITAVKTYAETLQKLRGLGLDDETYKKLLAEGPEAQAFASQLLKGGATAVQSISGLSKQLTTEASKLASQASINLYQAGVDIQKGLVDGLTKDMSALEKAMEKIAVAMIKALKKKLKIKSPSEVFAELGKFSMEGMAKGFSDSSKLVTDAVDQAAQDALTAMQKSMRNISNVVTDELNPNPVITPILDLTQVRTQSGELAALTSTAAAAYGTASAISSAQAVNAEQIAAAGGTSVKFEQNNYSPEALTEVEIYRQTKNQLSQLKSALALT